MTTVRNLNVLAADNPELASARDAVKECQTEPDTILEVRRILREHVAGG